MNNNQAMVDDQSESEDELAMQNIRFPLPLWHYDRYADLYTVSSTAVKNVAKIVKDEDFVRNNTPLSIESKLRLVETSKCNDLVGDGAAKPPPKLSFGEIFATRDMVDVRPILLDSSDEAPSAGFEPRCATKTAKTEPSIVNYSIRKTHRFLYAEEVLVYALKHNCLQDAEILLHNQFLPIFKHLFKSFSINFGNNSACIKIPSIKVKMPDLSCLYKWMLQNDAEFNIDEKLLTLLNEAKYLGIKQFVDQCWYTLSESPTLVLGELGTLKYYMMAREQRCEETMILMLTRIRKLFLWIVGTKDFLNFDVKELMYILKMHTICVNSEDEIFFSVIRWMEYNWEERKQHAQLLLKEVRFSQMEAGLRLSLCTVQENAILTELCDIPQILHWLKDALLFSVELMDNTRPRNRQRILNSITKYEQRNWIYIPGVPHHHNIQCPRYRPLTYETFKRFLIKVQNVGKDFMAQTYYIPQKYCYPYVCCHDLAGKDLKLGMPIQPNMYSTQVLKQFEPKDDYIKPNAKEMQAYYKKKQLLIYGAK